MIFRELRELDHLTDNVLIYGNDGSNDQKIKTDTSGRPDIVSDNLDIPLSDLEAVLDSIDANTDELEAKIQSIRDQFDVVLSSRSSEATSQSILDALGVASGTDIVTELQTIISNTTGLATEATLQEVADSLDTVEIKLQTIIDKLDVDLSTRASEATLVLVLSQLDIKLSELQDSIKGSGNKDFTTLEEDVEAILAQLDVVLSSRASESTLQSAVDAIGEASGTNLLVELQNILNKLTDIGDIDFATEATLVEVKNNLDDIKTKLDTLIATDFATESTLAEVRDTIGQESGSTVLSKLQNIWDKLVELFNTGVAKVKLWDGTNIAEITATNRLKVDTAPPTPPPATTPVKIDEYSDVTSSATFLFVIPSGETLFMTVFTAGGEVDATAGSVVELWYDPLGTGVGMTIIDTIFCAGNSDQHDLNEDFLGDGIITIRMVRNRLTGGAKWIAGGWEGYY